MPVYTLEPAPPTRGAAEITLCESLGGIPETAELNSDYRADHLHPVTGWPLREAVLLDDRQPGFLAGLSRTRNAHRQAIFFAFAYGVVPHPAAFLANDGLRTTARLGPDQFELARSLLVMPPSSIVQRVAGVVPDGFVAALGKLQGDPLRDPEGYHRLFTIFANSRHRRRRDIALSFSDLDDDRLDVVETLHDVLLDPKITARVLDGEYARHLTVAVQIIQQFVSTASTQALRKAISDMGPSTRLNDFLGRWIERADRFPECPFEVDPTLLVPITSGREMAKVGRELRNCLASKIMNVLAGRHYYYRCLKDNGAVVVLTKLSDGSWLLGAVSGFGNGHLGHRMYENIRAEFEKRGVRCHVPCHVDERFALADTVLNRRGWNDPGRICSLRLASSTSPWQHHDDPPSSAFITPKPDTSSANTLPPASSVISRRSTDVSLVLAWAISR